MIVTRSPEPAQATHTGTQNKAPEALREPPVGQGSSAPPWSTTPAGPNLGCPFLTKTGLRRRESWPSISSGKGSPVMGTPDKGLVAPSVLDADPAAPNVSTGRTRIVHTCSGRHGMCGWWALLQILGSEHATGVSSSELQGDAAPRAGPGRSAGGVLYI